MIKFFLRYSLISLFFFGCSYYISTLINVEQEKLDYINSVQSTISKLYKKSAIEFKNIEKALNKTPPFLFDQFIGTKNKIPFYIYQSEKCLYWFDNQIEIPAYIINKNKENNVINLKNNKYIVLQKYAKDKKGTIYNIYQLIPLQIKNTINNKYIKSGLNESIFLDKKIKINTTKLTESYANIVDPQNNFLFSIEFQDNFTNYSSLFYWIILILGINTFIGISCLIGSISNYFNEKDQYTESFLNLLIGIVGIRAIMLEFNFPFLLHPFKVFNPKYFAHSIINPSIGDFLLNIIGITILFSFILYNYRHFKLLYLLLNSKTKVNRKYSILLILFHIGSFVLFFIIVQTILLHSQWTMDITKDIEFDMVKYTCLVIFLIGFYLVFILTQISGRILLRLINFRINSESWFYIIGTYIIVFVLCFIFNQSILICVLASALFLFIQIKFRFPTSLNDFTYKTYLYLITTGFFAAIIGAIAIYDSENYLDLKKRQTYSTQLISENDMLGEFLIKSAADDIQNDGYIKLNFNGIFSDPKLISQKIARYYMSNYFDKYELQVSLFNNLGISIDDTLQKINYYDQKKKIYRYNKYATGYKDLFFVEDIKKNTPKKYVSFIKLEQNNILLGYIIVELRLKRIIPTSVFPVLLLDRKFSQDSYSDKFSYCIIENGEIQHTSGNFNYSSEIKNSFLHNVVDDLYLLNYNHSIIKTSEQRVIIVSSPAYLLPNIVSNFSFYFLLIVFVILIIISVYSSYIRFLNTKANLTTRIQIYLNIAFFLPLFVVSIFMIGAITSNYIDELKKEYAAKAERVGSTIADYTSALVENKITKYQFNNYLYDIAKYSENDINLFDIKGKLFFSNQPKMYENNILNGAINPEAFSAIMEKRDKSKILSETIGQLKYYVVYVGIKSFESGKLLGILGIPFFETNSMLDQQRIKIFCTIINIFSFVFIVFLIIAYFASEELILPLRLLRSRLKKLTLDEENEELKWNSADEIGLLVNEYNKMLDNLNKNKRQLSQSEKESAWREMARQVAHEIKNPLTPMKLSLQLTQRAINDEHPQVRAITIRTINNVLEQINTLSDIATSFSSFAKMPEPKKEKINICKVIKATAEFYNDSLPISISIPENDYYVIGDEQFISRITANLLINAIQAIPEGREPEISVKLELIENSIYINVKDNGVGIPAEYANKIFVPNFSTKFSGSGIGLALAKNGIEQAGGQIYFTSKINEFTVFTIVLPLVI